ncbi:hypothetical protein P2G54_00010, partial [Algoriphagus sp. CAU 1675]|nr:hypothetical protein [Algoriphagus sp. CAU 1675]
MEKLSDYQYKPKTPEGRFLKWLSKKFTGEVAGLSWFFLFFLLIQTNGFSQNPSNPVPVLKPVGGFEIDGNLLPGNNFDFDIDLNLLLKGGDWIRFDKADAEDVVFYQNLEGKIVPKESITTLRTVDLFGNGSGDNILAGKANEDPNNWSWSIGNANGKGDINNAYLHIGQDDQGNQWLIVGADRRETNGASYLDFEFFQNSTVLSFPEGGGDVTSSGADGGRTEGDIQISIIYSNGGSVPIIQAFTWRESIPGAGDWDYYESLEPLEYYAFTNQVDGVENPFGAFGSEVYSSFQFVEAAINIQAFLNGGEPCQDLTIGSVLVKTKTSGSLSAELDDFIFPIEASLIFGNATISYEGEDLCGDYAYVTQTGVESGVYSYVATDSLGNAGGQLFFAPTPEYPDGTIDLSASDPGDYYITYSFTTGGCDKVAKVFITIPNDAPPVTVVDQVFCENSGEHAFSATPDSGYTLNWYSDLEMTDFLGNDAPTVDSDVSGLGTFTYYVTQIKDGECESAPEAVNIEIVNCAIAVVKEATNGPGPEECLDPEANPIIYYSFTVTNQGEVGLANISLVDPLIGTLTGPTGDENDDDILQVDETWVYTGSYTILPEDIELGSVTNQATVTGEHKGHQVSDLSGTAVDNDDPTVVPVCHNFDYSITKVATPQTYDAVGDVISYDIRVTNEGNVTLRDILVTDPLTGLSQLVSTLAPGTDTLIVTTYTIKQSDLNSGKVDNTATASYKELVRTAEEQVTAIQDFDYSITKVATPQTYDAVGDVISYDIRVTNEGNVTLRDILVTDPLTGLSQLVSTLAPGTDTLIVTTYTIKQSDLNSGKVDNTATASYKELVRTAEEQVTAIQDFDYSITKVATPQTYDAVGDVISYDIRVTNEGNVTLRDILVTDPLTGLSQLISTLAPGTDTLIVTTYTIKQSDLNSGKVDNTATASYKELVR